MKPDGTADDSDDDVPLSKMNPKPQGAGKETPTKAPEAGDDDDLPLSFLSATKAKPTNGDAPKIAPKSEPTQVKEEAATSAADSAQQKKKRRKIESDDEAEAGDEENDPPADVRAPHRISPAAAVNCSRRSLAAILR
jgi:hypothetical protein